MALCLAWLPVRAAVDMDHLVLEMDPLDAEVLVVKIAWDTSTFPVWVVEPDGRRLSGRVEIKGQTARLLEKKPLLIKLSDGQKWNGQSRISLNAMATDGSLIREWLSWNMIYALGVAAPEVRYTRLTINGEDKGLFLRFEWIGPKTFARYGFGDDGELYDPDDKNACADLSPASVRENVEFCWGKITPRDNKFDSLRDLVAGIHHAPVESFDAFLERTFDAESVINWIAVTVLTENLTTYNNEYWPYYSRKLGKWTIMPWDYDRTFGRNFDPYLPYPQNKVENDNFQYYYPLDLGAGNPLRNKTLKNPALLKRVKQRIDDLVHGTPTPKQPWRGWFSIDHMERRIAELRAFLLPEVARDPYLRGGAEVFEEEVDAVRHYVRARVRYLERVVLASSDWERDRAEAALPAAGGRVDLVDGWGFLLASVSVKKSAAADRVLASIRRGRPEMAPPGFSRSACIKRTWFLQSQKSGGSVKADVTVEYLEEDSRANDVGRKITNQRQLRLYARDDSGWRELKTEVNHLANTLTVRDVTLPARKPLWLIACEPAPAETTAAR